MKNRTKSSEELRQETEFYRRQNLSSVDVRQISSPGSIDVYLHHHQLGEIGSMSRFFRRGKEVSVSYILPSIAI